MRVLEVRVNEIRERDADAEIRAGDEKISKLEKLYSELDTELKSMSGLKDELEKLRMQMEGVSCCHF